LVPAHERSRQAVAVAERYAEGSAGDEELRLAYSAAAAAADALEDEALDAADAATASAAQDWATCALRAAVGAVEAADLAHGAGDAERAAQAGLLREVFGNPFRPPPRLARPLLTWHGGAVPKLAQAIYEERSLPSGHLDAARLAVLADMLEEAGSTDAVLLGHLRSARPHSRGCFAVDAVLRRG
jgi:hypothetical protein